MRFHSRGFIMFAVCSNYAQMTNVVICRWCHYGIAANRERMLLKEYHVILYLSAIDGLLVLNWSGQASKHNPTYLEMHGAALVAHPVCTFNALLPGRTSTVARLTFLVIIKRLVVEELL